MADHRRPVARELLGYPAGEWKDGAVSDPTDILDLIDGALRDYGTSTDAMRWTPEPEQAEEHPIDAWMHATYGGVTSAEAMGAAERFMADLTSEAVRGIITALPPTPPCEPGRTALDDLHDLSRRILQDPYERSLPDRIEVDPVALEALRALAVDGTQPLWRVVCDPFGIPIHINLDLPRGGWRVLDRDGSVMHEGTVVPPVTCPGDCDRGA